MMPDSERRHFSISIFPGIQNRCGSTGEVAYIARHNRKVVLHRGRYQQSVDTRDRLTLALCLRG
jgi:hypothetical protein